ncbi:MAG: nucleotidyltransferase domain-containing protein, partial [Bacteroidota bacterium]
MENEKNYTKSQLDPSVLAPKSDLYPKIWNPDTKKLNDNIKIKLKQIGEDFIRGFKHPLKIKDIILTGSIANYNWNQYSDIDLHVLLDFNEIPDEYMEAFKDYFNSKKEIWNKTHNIMIVGHEVELYIQDINEPHYSTGVYSVLSDKWLTEPQFKKQDINYDDVMLKSEEFIEQINKLSELVGNKDYEKAKIGIDNLKKKIKKYRQAGLESGGEYSTENLVFKMLRNKGYLEQLSNMKTQAYDYDMGIEEEILRFQETLEEAKKKKKKKGKKDACYYKAKAKYKVWPSAYASGYLVKCRKKKGRIKEELDEEIEIDEILLEDLLDEIELDEQLIE